MTLTPDTTQPNATQPDAAGSNPAGSTAGAATSSTPTLRARLRRRRFWIVLAAVLVLGGGALLAIRGFGGVGGQPLGPADPSPTGAKAIVEVLRAQGVDVIEARSLNRAIGAAPGSTVLVYDESAVLGEDALTELAGSAAQLLLVEPDFTALRTLAPGVRHAGAAATGLDEVACELPAAVRAGSLSDGQRLFTIDEEAAGAGWQGCFADSGGFALAAGTTPDGTDLALVGAAAVFANGTIDEAGNAALALGLTGSRPTLVWYLPGPADADAGGPTLAELTPGWVSPLLVLAAIVTVAAGVVAGRRFGRLVVEDLPVEVRAGETTDGRARLYAAATARGHALDQLRIGTIIRLTQLLRLPRSAAMSDVVAAVATATGEPAHDVQRLLIDDIPATDRDLIDLAAALSALETRVRDRLTTVTDRPPPRPRTASDHGDRPAGASVSPPPDVSGSPTGRRP